MFSLAQSSVGSQRISSYLYCTLPGRAFPVLADTGDPGFSECIIMHIIHRA